MTGQYPVPLLVEDQELMDSMNVQRFALHHVSSLAANSVKFEDINALNRRIFPVHLPHPINHEARCFNDLQFANTVLLIHALLPKEALLTDKPHLERKWFDREQVVTDSSAKFMHPYHQQFFSDNWTHFCEGDYTPLNEQPLTATALHETLFSSALLKCTEELSGTLAMTTS